MSYLPYLCLFAYIDVQHILCCVFVFLRLVYPMLLVSLDCPFLIAPSVFSNIYLVQLFASCLVSCVNHNINRRYVAQTQWTRLIDWFLMPTLVVCQLYRN
jgi:hypothetical protein